MDALLSKIHEQHRAAVDGFFHSEEATLVALVEACATALKGGHKLLFCGNGGSACDAMHIAGEFVGRFVNDRPSLPAIALTADSGILTAVANDYGYDHVFSRQVEGLGQKGDILISLSTSGQSRSVLKALETAHKKGIQTALFTGEKGKGQGKLADFLLVVPSPVTAHIQETHQMALHALASLVEARLGK